MKKTYARLLRLSLILVYLVIIAGALVRMTGSGMGCPDWPKCFGYYIPPTDVETLTWEENRDFKKGHVIIKDEKLLVAKETFTTQADFDIAHWEPYTKHDYATFNVYHTWTEYVNRLCGALAGLACFLMAIWSFSYRKEKVAIVWVSWLVVFMMGFQGWLGAKVVESVLIPEKITTHMMVAILIVALVLLLVHWIKPNKGNFKKDKSFQILLWLGLMTSVIQIYLGTQVRQFVDTAVKAIGSDDMSTILAAPDWHFYVHRTFSFAVVGIALFAFFRNRKLQLGFNKMNWIIAMIIIEVASGIAMYYFHFPFGMQTVHLLFATILFGIQFYMILEYYGKPKDK